MSASRFFRNRSIAAFRELLQEKVPVGEPIMKVVRHEEQEIPRLFRQQEQYYREGSGSDLARPACHLLSNGLVSALCTDTGAVRLVDDRGESPVRTHLQENYAPAGVSFFYRDGEGRLHSLTHAPLGAEGDWSWFFSGSEAHWKCNGTSFNAEVSLHLPKGERGALWSVEWTGDGKGELVCYLEPMLARQADYFAHPAYSKLSLVSKTCNHGVTFTRRPKSGAAASFCSIKSVLSRRGRPTCHS